LQSFIESVQQRKGDLLLIIEAGERAKHTLPRLEVVLKRRTNELLQKIEAGEKAKPILAKVELYEAKRIDVLQEKDILTNLLKLGVKPSPTTATPATPATPAQATTTTPPAPSATAVQEVFLHHSVENPDPDPDFPFVTKAVLDLAEKAVISAGKATTSLMLAVSTEFTQPQCRAVLACLAKRGILSNGGIVVQRREPSKGYANRSSLFRYFGPHCLISQGDSTQGQLPLIQPPSACRAHVPEEIIKQCLQALIELGGRARTGNIRNLVNKGSGTIEVAMEKNVARGRVRKESHRASGKRRSIVWCITRRSDTPPLT
jgi:hypothetical protein